MFCLEQFTESLKSIVKSYHERIVKLEDSKFDLEYLVKRKDMEVSLAQFFERRIFARRDFFYSRLKLCMPFLAITHRLFFFNNTTGYTRRYF